jgi:SAM-dependent methyltransferase
MSHKAQREYIRSVRKLFPSFFSKESKVLEIGSLDINGSCRRFFSSQFYIGCDIGKGRGVDLVSHAHKLTFSDGFFDCIVSCEAFEHDKYLPSTLFNIIRMLKSGGLFMFTCATIGREEHGTTKHPESSPFTNDYYKNISVEYFRGLVNVDEYFSEYKFDIDMTEFDLRFYGVKK